MSVGDRYVKYRRHLRRCGRHLSHLSSTLMPNFCHNRLPQPLPELSWVIWHSCSKLLPVWSPAPASADHSPGRCRLQLYDGRRAEICGKCRRHSHMCCPSRQIVADTDGRRRGSLCQKFCCGYYVAGTSEVLETVLRYCSDLRREGASSR